MAALLDCFVCIEWTKLLEINFGEIKLSEIDFGECFCNKAQAVETLTYGDFKHEINEDGTATITGYTGIDISVTIPSKIVKNLVTTINENVFKHNKIIVDFF